MILLTDMQMDPTQSNVEPARSSILTGGEDPGWRWTSEGVSLSPPPPRLTVPTTPLLL